MIETLPQYERKLNVIHMLDYMERVYLQRGLLLPSRDELYRELVRFFRRKK